MRSIGGDRVTRCEKSFPFSTVLIENVYEKHLEKFKNFGFLDRYIYKIVKSKEQRLNVFFHQFLLVKLFRPVARHLEGGGKLYKLHWLQV